MSYNQNRISIVDASLFSTSCKRPGKGTPKSGGVEGFRSSPQGALSFWYVRAFEEPKLNITFEELQLNTKAVWPVISGILGDLLSLLFRLESAFLEVSLFKE